MVILLYAPEIRGSIPDAKPIRKGRAAFRFAAVLSLAAIAGPSGQSRVLAQDTGSGTVQETPGEIAVRQITEGKYSSAAQHLRQAMEVTPDDALLNVAAGTVAVSTGDVDTARSAFEHALHSDANDSLALYGLGLARLAKGDRAGALSSFDRSEAAGGDRSYLLMARRYTQWLSGAQVAMAGAPVSQQLAPSQGALQAMQAEREGGWQSAAAQMQGALAAVPGDPMLEPGGVLMNFDPARPLSTGAPRLLHVMGAQHARAGAVAHR